MHHLNPKNKEIAKSKAFIDAVIDEVKYGFKQGKDVVKRVNKQFVHDPDLKKIYREEGNSTAIVGKDLRVNASRIPNSAFTAACGPSTWDLETYLLDVAYHPTQPVALVVALGDTVCDNEHYHDFCDYALTPRTRVVGELTLTVRHLSGIVQTTQMSKQKLPYGTVHTELCISHPKHGEKTVHVTTFSIHDNRSLNLGHGAESSVELNALGLHEQQVVNMRLHEMWQVYLQSLQQPVWVHCGAGVGRTGHVILTMELVKQYPVIFAGDDAKAIAERVLLLLSNMRSVRPGLIFTLDQFISAIRNANTLFHYGVVLECQLPKAVYIDKCALATWYDLEKYITNLHEQWGDNDLALRKRFINLFLQDDFVPFLIQILRAKNLSENAIVAFKASFPDLLRIFTENGVDAFKSSYNELVKELESDPLTAELFLQKKHTYTLQQVCK